MPSAVLADDSPDQTRELIRLLARKRAAQGMTQADVARQMGTSQPYIARLEKAMNDPRLSTVLKYATIVLGGVLLAQAFQELEGRPGA